MKSRCQSANRHSWQGSASGLCFVFGENGGLGLLFCLSSISNFSRRKLGSFLSQWWIRENGRGCQIEIPDAGTGWIYHRIL